MRRDLPVQRNRPLIESRHVESSIVAASPSKDRNGVNANAARHGPLASFSNNQWYCHQSRQSVFFSSFSSAKPDTDYLVKLAADIIAFVPQLATHFQDANASKAITPEILTQIVEHIEVDDLNAYPDGWNVSSDPLFDRPDLPMLRIFAAVRRDGADDKGRQAAILVLSTHALLEGADSALLTRSQHAGHDELGAPPTKRSPIKHMLYTAIASILAPLQLVAAFFLAPREVDIDYRALTIPRDKLRRIATHIGIRQRSLMFALVCHTLNNGGKGFSKRKISAIYADLEGKNVTSFEDEFFRYRMMEASFPVSDDFITFAKDVETEILRLEASDVRATQSLLNALFGMHRWMKNNFPFLYSDRTFRFGGFYHLDLSVTPPHQLRGPLTKGMMEPVYCGTHHPGLNICVFVPGRKEVTFNFTMNRRHLDNIDKVEALLQTFDQN